MMVHCHCLPNKQSPCFIHTFYTIMVHLLYLRWYFIADNLKERSFFFQEVSVNIIRRHLWKAKVHYFTHRHFSINFYPKPEKSTTGPDTLFPSALYVMISTDLKLSPKVGSPVMFHNNLYTFLKKIMHVCSWASHHTLLDVTQPTIQDVQQ